MSESGDISEFGYIMELLARGKVSAGARGTADWAPTPGTTQPVAPHSRHCSACGCRRPGPLKPPGRAGLESQVSALSQGAPAAAECKVDAFFFFFFLIARHF